MADIEIYCPHCAEKKPHTTISEGRIHICATCGRETKFKPGEKGPAPKEPKPAPYVPGVVGTETKAAKSEMKAVKTETEGTRMRLTDEQKADIKRRVDEAIEEEKGAVRYALAKELGVSYNCILVNSKGGARPARASTKRAASQGKHEARGSEPVSGFKTSFQKMVAKAVAEQVEAALSDLEDRVSRLVKREMGELLK